MDSCNLYTVQGYVVPYELVGFGLQLDIAAFLAALFPGGFPVPNIRLEPVTVHNWLECIHLSLLEGQKDLVPSNLYSIAEAQFYPEARPLVIYNELDQMVGFIMYGRDIFSGKWKIFRLMVAATYQGNGYGRAAMLHILAEISQKPDGQEILVCYQDRNHIARKLYAQLGFLEQTLDEKGVITAQYKRPAGKA